MTRNHGPGRQRGTKLVRVPRDVFAHALRITEGRSLAQLAYEHQILEVLRQGPHTTRQLYETLHGVDGAHPSNATGSKARVWHRFLGRMWRAEQRGMVQHHRPFGNRTTIVWTLPGAPVPTVAQVTGAKTKDAPPHVAGEDPQPAGTADPVQ